MESINDTTKVWSTSTRKGTKTLMELTKEARAPMGGQLIVKTRLPGIPMILRVHVVLYGYLLFATLQMLFLAGYSLLSGDLYSFAFNGLIGTFLLWYFGGGVIETALCCYLAAQIGRGNFGKIERAFARALPVWKKSPLRKYDGYIRTLTNQALMRMLLGDYDKAEMLMKESLQLLDRHKRLQKTDLAAILTNNLASLLLRKGELEQGEAYATRSLAIYQNGKGRSPNASAFPKANLGWIRLQQNRLDEAEQYLTEALKSSEPGKLPMTILPLSGQYTRMNCLFNLAITLYKLGKTSEAAAICEDLQKTLDEDRSSVTVTALQSLSRLAHVLIERQDFERAEKLLEHSYYLAGRFPDHPDAMGVLQAYSELLALTDRQSEIKDLKSWVRPVLLDAPH